MAKLKFNVEAMVPDKDYIMKYKVTYADDKVVYLCEKENKNYTYTPPMNIPCPAYSYGQSNIYNPSQFGFMQPPAQSATFTDVVDENEEFICELNESTADVIKQYFNKALEYYGKSE